MGAIRSLPWRGGVGLEDLWVYRVQSVALVNCSVTLPVASQQ